jgi:signal transduction histidine kinase/ActR/RegA family two-component response regulator
MAAFYRVSNRILRNADPAVATAIIVALATVIAMSTAMAMHLSIPFLSSFMLGIESSDYPLSVILINSGAAAIVTSLPIVAYCMGLVRRLRETKYQLKGAVAAAEAANAAKSSFLANMSHEIRTPLNGMLGMADVLSQEHLSPLQTDCVGTIRESGKSLMAILNDVLDLSKIEAGKLEISAVDSNLHLVFFSIHKLFLPRAEEKNITLTLQLGESVPRRLRFDTVRVRQCVSNLVSNAVKFTETGNIVISVSAAMARGGLRVVTVDVSDTGIGMSEEVMSRLFSDYAQADASTSRKFGGSGLGLAISRKLAQLMDGDVTMKSKAGEGTVFTFQFKAAPAQPQTVSHEAPLSPRPGGDSILDGLRVLLVDDNAVNRKVARMLLKPTRMAFVEAENGQQALDLLAQTPFDLVLLDVHMPVMDGTTTIKHIRASPERWNSVPVIALTADAMSGERERLLALGMTGYATKPIDQRALVGEIMRVQGGEAEAGWVRGIAAR